MRSGYTPRRRVLETLNHKEPDRVPIDLGGMLSTGIHAIAYAKLKEHLGLRGGAIRVLDTFQFLAIPEEPVLKFVWADVRPLIREPKEWRKWCLADGTECLVPYDFRPKLQADGSYVYTDSRGVTLRMPPKGYYFDMIRHPLSGAEDVGDLKKYDWDALVIREELPHWESLREMGERARKLYAKEYAVMFNFGGNVFEGAWALRGFSKFLADLIRRPHMAEFIMDKLVEVYEENFRIYMRYLKGYFDIVQVGDDLGHQEGPIIPPKIYRKLVKPRHEELYSFIKKESGGAYLFMHSCGSIYTFIPDLIEIGVDIINPVQVSARDMDTKRLKEEFGDEIVFWGGGCDTQRILPLGTPDEVRDEVRRRISDLAPGGGFVFAQVHNIQPEVPPVNIVAMYEAVHEYGWYR